MALCKELGLDEDDSLAPVPKRRKAKIPGIALEEKISSASQQTGPGTSASKNATNQQGLKTQVFFKAKTSEDRENRQTPPQLDKTAACPSRTELKSIGEDRTCKDASEQSNSSSLRNQDCLITTSSSALEKGRDATHESNCDHFMDGKTKVHRTGSSERLSCLEERSSHAGPVGGEGLAGNTCRTDFNVPPSPGHIEPQPDKLSRIHPTGSSQRLSSMEERSSQGGSVGGEGLAGNRTDFNVPPSPGHIEPQPDKLSRIHHLLQKGEPLPKVLKF